MRADPPNRAMSVAAPRLVLPERFNRLEAMLFASVPADLRRAAERYAGELLAQPVAPPRLAPSIPSPTPP